MPLPIRPRQQQQVSSSSDSHHHQGRNGSSGGGGGRVTLTDAQIRDVRARYRLRRRLGGIKQLAVLYGVSEEVMSHVVHSPTYRRLDQRGRRRQVAVAEPDLWAS